MIDEVMDIESEIRDLYKRLKEIQEGCEHIRSEVLDRGSRGSYLDGDKIYWTRYL